MPKCRNRHTRKRYWQIRRKAIYGTISNKKDKQQNNRIHRKKEKAQLRKTTHDDTWDVCTSHKRIEPWEDWPSGSVLVKSWEFAKPYGPVLTAEEAKRLPGAFRQDWIQSQSWVYHKSKSYWGNPKKFFYNQKRKFVDFNKLYNWLRKNYCNAKFNAFEKHLSESISWRKVFDGTWYEYWDSKIDNTWRFPPLSLLEDWLNNQKKYTRQTRKSVIRSLASHAEHFGYWFWTTNRELEYPEENSD